MVIQYSYNSSLNKRRFPHPKRQEHHEKNISPCKALLLRGEWWGSGKTLVTPCLHVCFRLVVVLVVQPFLVSELLPKLVIPALYETIELKLERTVDLGPFKHKAREHATLC